MSLRLRSIAPLTVHACLLLAYLFFAYDFPSLTSSPHAAAGTVTIVQTTSLGALDPFAADSSDRAVLGLLYEPLMRRDEAGNLQPALAQTWHVRDNEHFVIRLREEAMFSDGRAVTCDDVTASLKRARNIANIDASPSSSDVCVISHPTGTYLPDILPTVFITPADFTPSALAMPLGTGPYRLTQRTKDNLTLKIDEHHPDGASAPQLISFIAEPDSTRRSELIREKHADVLLDQTLTSVPAGYRMITTPSQTAFIALFDTQRIPLTTRVALASAFQLAGLPADLGLLPLPQLIPATIIGALPAQESAPIPKSEGTLTLATTAANEPIAKHLRSAAKSVGISLSIEIIDEKNTESTLASGAYDIVLVGWDFGRGSVHDFLSHVLHSPTITHGLLNGFGYRSPEADHALDDALTETSDEKRRDLIRQALLHLIESDHIGMPIASAAHYMLTRDALPFTRSPDGTLIIDPR